MSASEGGGRKPKAPTPERSITHEGESSATQERSIAHAGASASTPKPPERSAPSRAENAIFARPSRAAWLGAGALHALIGVAGVAALSLGLSPEAVRTITSVVNFEAPPPPPPPPPLPVTPVEPVRARPRPAVRRAPTPPPVQPEPQPAQPQPVAPPPLMTAHSTGRSSDTVASGSNSDYHGGTTSQTGTGREPTTAPPVAPPTVADAGTAAPPERPSRSGAVAVPEGGPALEALERPAPTYPPEASAAGIHGTVHVGIIIAEDGHVLQAAALRGPAELREAARQAALRFRFRPYVFEGQALRLRYVVPITFELNNL